MTIAAAIGRIDHIIQLQQQILDPAAAASTSTTTGASLSTPSSGSSTNFATALAQAQAQAGTTATAMGLPGTTTDPTGLTGLTGTTTTDPSGLTGTTGATGLAGVTGVTGLSGGVAAGTSDPRVQAMVTEANSLVGKPYVWGGGHGSWAPQTGYDCSGFVSAVLHAGGYLSSPQDTVSLPSAPGIVAGPGQHVTIYDRSGAGENGHVIISIDGQFYESGGETGSWGGGGGVAKIGTPPASYLATFDKVLHPEGL
jgi:cell wall-associated NlpC family hydrolase